MKSGAVSPIDNIALHLPPSRSGQQPESLYNSAERVIVDATGPGIQVNRDCINDNLVGASGRRRLHRRKVGWVSHFGYDAPHYAL